MSRTRRNKRRFREVSSGGSEAAARCHMARTVCRRAEREAVSLGKIEAVNPNSLRYLNRLSDLLFALAVPESCGETHLKLLSQVAEIFSDHELLKELRQFCIVNPRFILERLFEGT